MKTFKAIVTSYILTVFAFPLFSQVSVIPQGFNYQAIARDTLGSPKANQNVTVRFTITNQTETSTPYIETHTKTTDEFGLFTAVIGQGVQTGGTGTFSQIDWLLNNYYTKIEIQEGLNWFLIGKEPLLSVPYAMVAKQAIYAVPTGTVVAFTGNTPPTGWLICDGTNYDKNTYPDLYNLIGITYGGVLGANFNVPDYRGMFLRGAGANGLQTDATGVAFNGGVIGNYQADKFQAHHHTTQYEFWRYAGVNRIPDAGTTMATANSDLIGDPESDGINGTPRTGSETKPASYSVNYIIKY